MISCLSQVRYISDFSSWESVRVLLCVVVISFVTYTFCNQSTDTDMRTRFGAKSDVRCFVCEHLTFEGSRARRTGHWEKKSGLKRVSYLVYAPENQIGLNAFDNRALFGE